MQVMYKHMVEISLIPSPEFSVIWPGNEAEVTQPDNNVEIV